MMSLSAVLSQEQMATPGVSSGGQRAAGVYTRRLVEDFIKAIKKESQKLTEEQIGV
jgi:hypothetical protein